MDAQAMSMPLEDDDDSIADLIEQVRDGDVAAIKRLYALCSVVYPHALRLCGDPALAREVHHDTVTEIWKGRAPFRGESRFTTWAISIARRLAFRAMKARSVEVLGVQAACEAEAAGEEAADDDACDPFHALARRQQRDGVLDCIGKLSPKLGECLLLVHYADMSQSEVAAVLGLNLNTVKARIREAHKSVQACLKRLAH